MIALNTAKVILLSIISNIVGDLIFTVYLMILQTKLLQDRMPQENNIYCGSERYLQWSLREWISQKDDQSNNFFSCLFFFLLFVRCIELEETQSEISTKIRYNKNKLNFEHKWVGELLKPEFLVSHIFCVCVSKLPEILLF